MTAITNPPRSDWSKAIEAWNAFVEFHPELGMVRGKWGFHNFLRNHRAELVRVDAIRLSRNRFWIVNRQRFSSAAFELATGKGPLPEGFGV